MTDSTQRTGELPVEPDADPTETHTGPDPRLAASGIHQLLVFNQFRPGDDRLLDTLVNLMGLDRDRQGQFVPDLDIPNKLGGGEGFVTTALLP